MVCTVQPFSWVPVSRAGAQVYPDLSPLASFTGDGKAQLPSSLPTLCLFSPQPEASGKLGPEGRSRDWEERKEGGWPGPTPAMLWASLVPPDQAVGLCWPCSRCTLHLVVTEAQALDSLTDTRCFCFFVSCPEMIASHHQTGSRGSPSRSSPHTVLRHPSFPPNFVCVTAI